MTSTTKPKILIDAGDPAGIAAAVNEGLTTIHQVDRWIGDEDISTIEGDVLVLAPRTWHADDGNAEIVGEFGSAQEAAEAYVESGDWGESNKTTWVNVYTWRAGVNQHGEVVQQGRECHKIEIEAQQPVCNDPEGHDWKSEGGPWGHGGGIIEKDRCTKCGLLRTYDSWAQDPQDGTQGLDSVEYTRDE